uniref:Uncharacterized protein n=1 Tax=Oryzias sinensis TaxID=183150 RepID=A0A8C8A0W2_9TELE
MDNLPAVTTVSAGGGAVGSSKVVTKSVTTTQLTSQSDISGGRASGGGSGGSSRSVLTSSSSSHHSGLKKRGGSGGTGAVAVSSGGFSTASGAGEGFKAAGRGSSSMSQNFASAGKDGKREAGLGAVTVSTVTKSSYSSGGAGEAKRGPLSPSAYSLQSKERKSASTTAAMMLDVFDESSSRDSSPEYNRKEYGTYKPLNSHLSISSYPQKFAFSLAGSSSAASSLPTRGRAQSRESEIRARLQSASPPARWTELDDVKRLLRGNRSTSTSPPQSPNNTLPIPKKASVETRTLSDSSPDQYNGMWSGDAGVGGYGYNTNPNNFSTTAPLYQSGVQNNLTLGSPSVNTGLPASGSAPVYGVQNNLGGTSQPVYFPPGSGPQIVYGVQKNVSGSSSSAARPSSSANHEALGKDSNFVLIEKENAPIKKETERLVMDKDTGKQFMTAAPSTHSASYSEDSLKREKQKLVSSSGEDGVVAKRKTLHELL